MVAPVILFSSACGAKAEAADIEVERAGVGTDQSRAAAAEIDA